MQIGLGIGTTFRQKWVPSLTEQIRSLLFSASEQGAWYDPSDMSTLFQDSAGTTPVTALEQPVGRMLDKSGRGNHATQATTTKRPTYSRRVNCIGSADTRTLANATLLKSGTGLTPIVTPNYAMAPDGTMTAIRVQVDCGSGLTSTDYSLVSAGFPTGQAQLGGAKYITKYWMRATSGTASVIVVGAGANAIPQTLTETWTLISLSETGIAGSGFALRISSGGGVPATRGAQDVLVWQPQLILAADQNLPYQWNQSATDYDADPAKFPAYLRWDGVDDALSTGNIDFTSTDKMTVWAGVFKSDAAAGTQHVAYSNGDDFNGFAVYANSNRWIGYSSGATGYAIAADPLSIANTQNSVLAVSADQIAPYSRIRRDYKQVMASTAAQGGGGYGNRRLHIGARAGTSLYFNGRLYSLIIRGAQSSLSQIEATEAYIKQKMRLP